MDLMTFGMIFSLLPSSGNCRISVTWIFRSGSLGRAVMFGDMALATRRKIELADKAFDARHCGV
jgi:hypothetical protein